jgi:hypothetical protein
VGKHDKRGANLGGESSGRHGRKTGGAAYTAGEPTDRGTLTCPRCQGATTVERPHLETDEDGGFAGADVMTCPNCGGEGTVGA